jgi:hypothetical protein
VSKNKVLRGIFGPNWEEVAGSCRRLHSEELHNLYASPNFIRVRKTRKKRWVGHVARMVGMIDANRIVVGKCERQRPLGRPERRCVDLTEIGRKGVDWMHLA